MRLGRDGLAHGLDVARLASASDEDPRPEADQRGERFDERVGALLGAQSATRDEERTSPFGRELDRSIQGGLTDLAWPQVASIKARRQTRFGGWVPLRGIEAVQNSTH